jgi:AraC-like DNA-binding protein
MRNFVPVKKLMALFSGQEKTVKGENEFNWIERKIRDTQTILGNNQKTLRKYYINVLLGKPFDPINGKREMERYNIKLDGEWNLVVIFTVNVPIAGRMITESESESINSMTYKVINIFTEAVSNSEDKENFAVEMIDAGEHAVAIVNRSGDKDDFIYRLEAKIEHTQEEAARLLHVPVQAAMGEPRRGPDGIYYSNMEAVETLKYLDPESGQATLRYRDIEYSGDNYRYSFETEQKLVDLVRMGDSEAACAILRQIWAENTANNRFGYMNRLLAYNLLGSLVKGMNKGMPSNFHPQGLNLENASLSELINSLEKAAGEICKSNTLLLGHNKRDHRLSEKIKNYVDENFTDPNINVSITSYHFNMTSYYLATIFKQETGKNLLEYINTLRVEEGKNLLKEGCEVSEAAVKCGFRNAGAFIRVFKKFTGVTPGQYKDRT